MTRLTIHALEPVELMERDEPRNRDPLWVRRNDGRRERLTQRHDRGGGMLASLMIAAVWIVLAWCGGIVYGRAHPIEPAPVAEVRKW